MNVYLKGAFVCLVAVILLVAVVVAVNAAPLTDGNCEGYTWATGVILATPPGRITVYIDGNLGTRWTALRFQVGEPVLVRGFACWGRLDGRFSVRRVR